MSSDGDSDVNPESVNTGVFPCSHPVSSQVKPKTGRLTEAEKLRQDAILNVNIDLWFIQRPFQGDIMYIENLYFSHHRMIPQCQIQVL